MYFVCLFVCLFVCRFLSRSLPLSPLPLSLFFLSFPFHSCWLKCPAASLVAISGLCDLLVQARPGFNLMGYLQSPMVIMILVGGGLMLIIKLMWRLDPETMAEVMKQQNSGGAKKKYSSSEAKKRQ
jgi:hypothetical protein